MLNVLKNSETDLLSRLAKGDHRAFDTLYTQYSQLVNNFVQRYVKSQAMADDIVQEVFMKIWEKREDVPGVESFRAYLFTIAKNYTLNVLKKASRSAEAMREIFKNYETVYSPIENDIQLQAYWEALTKILQSLPEQTRRVYDLCREQEKSYEEVAEILGISRNAVKKHMVRSNKALKVDFLHKIPVLVILHIISK